MIEEALNVVDRKEMFSVHGNDDGVPNLRNKHLGLVLDFHVAGGKNFGVDSFGETLKDVCKRRG